MIAYFMHFWMFCYVALICYPYANTKLPWSLKFILESCNPANFVLDHKEEMGKKIRQKKKRIWRNTVLPLAAEEGQMDWE